MAGNKQTVIEILRELHGLPASTEVDVSTDFGDIMPEKLDIGPRATVTTIDNSKEGVGNLFGSKPTYSDMLVDSMSDPDKYSTQQIGEAKYEEDRIARQKYLAGASSRNKVLEGINSELAQIDSVENANKDRWRQESVKKMAIPAFSFDQESSAYATPIHPEQKKLEAARVELRAAKKAAEAYNETDYKTDEINGGAKPFYQRFADGVMSTTQDEVGNMLSMGFYGLSDTKRVNQALEKSSKGEKLSEADKLMISSLAHRQEAERYNQSNGGSTIMTSIGEGMPATVEFMLGIAATGGSLGITKQIVSKGVKRQVGKTMLQAATREAARTPLTGTMWDNLADRTQRQFSVDGDGNVVKDNPENFVSMLYKSYASAYAENMSEQVGNFIPGNVVGNGLRKAMPRVLGAKIGGYVDNGISWAADNTKQVRDILRKTTNWNGTLDEFIEEEFNNIAEPLLTFEPERLKDGFTLKNQLVTLGSVATIGGAMHSMSLPSLARSTVRNGSMKAKVNGAIRNIEDEGFRDGIFKAIKLGTSIEDKAAKLSSLNWENISMNDRASAIDAFTWNTNLEVYKGVDEQQQVQEESGKQIQLYNQWFKDNANEQSGQMEEITGENGDRYWLKSGTLEDNAVDGMIFARNAATGEIEQLRANSVKAANGGISYEKGLASMLDEINESSVKRLAEDGAVELESDAKESGVSANFYNQGDEVTLSDGSVATFINYFEDGSNMAQVAFVDPETGEQNSVEIARAQIVGPSVASLSAESEQMPSSPLSDHEGLQPQQGQIPEDHATLSNPMLRAKAEDITSVLHGQMNNTEVPSPQRSFEVGDNVKQRWNESPKTYGIERNIITPGDESIRGRYVLTESGAVTPSHNTETFSKSAGFPVTDDGSTVNDRDYSRDRDAQQQVVDIAQRYNGRALDNPVVVTRDGIVVSGNNRTMSGELAAKRGTDAAYLQHLKENAAQWGFTTKQISEYSHPRVVFEMTDTPSYNTGTFSKFNASDTKTQNKVEKAIRLGKTIDAPAINRLSTMIDEHNTLGNFYADTRSVAGSIKELVTSGIITQSDVAELKDGNNLSAIGKDMFETLLVGSVLSEDAVRLINRDGMKRYRAKITKAILPLFENRRLGRDYNVTGELNEAVVLLDEAQRSGLSVEDVMRQLDAFDNSEYSPLSITLARTLESSPERVVKSLITLYNSQASGASNGQRSLYAGDVPSKQSILEDMGLIPISVKTDIGAEKEAVKEYRTIGNGEFVVDLSSILESSDIDRLLSTANNKGDGQKITITDSRNGADISSLSQDNTGRLGQDGPGYRTDTRRGGANSLYSRPSAMDSVSGISEDSTYDENALRHDEASVGVSKTILPDVTDQGKDDRIQQVDGGNLAEIQYGQYERGTTNRVDQGSNDSSTATGSRLGETNTLVSADIVPIINNVKALSDIMLNSDVLKEAEYLTSKAPVTVLASPLDLVDVYGEGITDDDRSYIQELNDVRANLGVYDAISDKVYLFADRLDTPKKLRQAWLHEISHAANTKVFAQSELIKIFDTFGLDYFSKLLPDAYTESYLETVGAVDEDVAKATLVDEVLAFHAMKFCADPALKQLINGTFDVSKLKGDIGKFTYQGLSQYLNHIQNGIYLYDELSQDVAKSQTVEGSDSRRDGTVPNAVEQINADRDSGSRVGVRGRNRTDRRGFTNEISTRIDDGGESYVQDAPRQSRQTTSQAEKTTTRLGEFNTIVSADRIEELRRRAKDKLSQLNSGFDPELFAILTELSAGYIEAGVRKFADFSTSMIAEFGDKVRPYLASIYEGARRFPGMEQMAKDMDTTVYVDTFDLNTLNNKHDVRNSTKDLQRSGTVTEDRESNHQEALVGQRGTGERYDQRDLRQDSSDAERNGDVPVRRSDNGLGNHISNQQADGGAGSVGDISGIRDAGRGDINNDARLQNTGRRTAAHADTVSTADENSVRESTIEAINREIPCLQIEQAEDVYKAEKRFSNNNGILFTNGTGTGKTFSGLGIVSRFYNRGKQNVIIVVPNDKIENDWVETAAKYFNLKVSKLATTKDAGGGVVAATYANFRQNDAILGRNFDLVVYDESHYLNQSESGVETISLTRHRQITPTIAKSMQKAILDIVGEEPNRRADLSDDVAVKAYEAERREWNRKVVDNNSAIVERAKMLYNTGTKVVMLSATPFAYVKNLIYGDGLLFSINETFDKESNASTGYNQGGRFDRFMMSNFGYRMRYNKLTKPENSGTVSVNERLFHEKLKREGAISGRQINVPFDYERLFVTVKSGIGSKIDEGINKIHTDKRLNILGPVLAAKWGFVKKSQFLEAAKSSGITDHVDNLLASGKKIVIYHNFIKENTENPLIFKPLTPEYVAHMSDSEERRYAQLNDKIDSLNDNEMSELIELEGKKSSSEVYREVRGEIEKYNKAVVVWNSEYSEYSKLDFTGIESPINTLTKRYGDRIRLFNGTVSKKNRLLNSDLFNGDESNVDIILVQRQAGKEGISFHDKSGQKQRVLINLGLPTAPTDAIQIEGRIYRIGLQSDAVFEYPILNTSFEQSAFAEKVAQRSKTAENLALGNQSRRLDIAFKDGYLNAVDIDNIDINSMGKGSKESDQESEMLSGFREAVAIFQTVQKNSKQRQNREGIDYYATAEPIGYKMVEILHSKDNDQILEPSAGHGAIARFIPENMRAVAVEPSFELASKLRVNSNAEVINSTFEDLYIGRKFDGIVMNPPFGVGGKTAIEHLEKAFRQLRNGGRLVAIIPGGESTNRRLSAFFSKETIGGRLEYPNANLTADISLPGVAFKNAGTSISTRILVIDKTEHRTYTKRIDLSYIDNLNSLFDAIEDLDVARDNDMQTTVEDDAMSGQVVEASTDVVSAPEVIQHTKTGKDLYLSGIIERVDTDVYKEINAIAKSNNGYYSSYAKGFLFKSESDATTFKNQADSIRDDVRFREVDGYSELEQIKSNAVERGNFMKSPNGQPTNLSEYQWLQVRTGAFKEWFGDWEKAHRIEKLPGSTPIEITGDEITPSEDLKEYRRNAIEYGKNLRGEYVNKDTGATITLSRSGIVELMQHDTYFNGHLQSIAAIPSIIEKSIFIESLANEDTKVKADKFDYFVVGLKIRDVDYTVKMVVADIAGKRYYDHKLTQIEKGRLIDLVRIPNLNQENIAALSQVKDTRLLSILQNNSSKVVDANGEPMVVYHGTSKEFNEFKYGKINGKEGSFFFAQNIEDAEGYSSGSVMGVFVNLRNPIDFNKLSLEVLRLDDKKAIVDKLKSTGHDGWMADLEDGWGEVSAFYPSQIKSATANRGTFSKANADIRYNIMQKESEAQREYEAKKERKYISADKRKAQSIEQLHKLSKKFNIEIVIVDSVRDLPDNLRYTTKGKRFAGFYHKTTGQVYFVASEIRDMDDATATFLHEVVSHKGLDELMGKDRANEFYTTVFDCLDAKEQIRLLDKYGSKVIAGDEVVARMAEGDVIPSVMQRIIAAVRRFFRDVLGVPLTINDNDIRYILWKSKNNLQRATTIAQVMSVAQRDHALQSKLYPKRKALMDKINDLSKDVWETNGAAYFSGDDVRFREPDLHVRRASNVAPIRVAGGKRSAKSIGIEIQQGLQDATIKVKMLQDLVVQNGGSISNLTNVYEALNHQDSRAKAVMGRYNNVYLKPVKEFIKGLEGKVTYDEFTDYMLAEGSIERHDSDSGVNALSEAEDGMWTREVTQGIVSDIESKVSSEKLAEFWTIWNRATVQVMDMAVNSGRMSIEEKNAILAKGWKRYVPLRGKDFDFEGAIDLSELFYINGPLGKRGAVVSTKVANKRALGRSSKAGDPIAALEHMANLEAYLSEVNIARRYLLRLVQQHAEMRDLFSLRDIWYVKTGEVWVAVDQKPSIEQIVASRTALKEIANLERQIKKESDPAIVEELRADIELLHEDITVTRRASQTSGYRGIDPTAGDVEVMKDGVKYIVRLEDIEVAQAIVNKSDAVQSWLARSFVGGTTRFMSQLATSKNPAFMAPNFIRDLQHGALYSFVDSDGNTLGYLKHSMTSWKTLHRNITNSAQPLTVGEIGDKSLLNAKDRAYLRSKYGKDRLNDTFYDIFVMNGGETGYVHILDPRQYQRKLEKEFHTATGSVDVTLSGVWNGTRKGWKAVNDGVDYIANMSENEVRYAAFMSQIEKGTPVFDAVTYAKNITVNFNRKGKYSKGIGALMMFFNAAVQGTQNFYSLWGNKKGKSAREITMQRARFLAANAAMAAIGYWSASMMYEMLAGLIGDDDQKFKVSDYERRTNLIVPMSGTEKGYIKIPIPIAARPFYTLGVLTQDCVNGMIAPGEVMTTFAASLIDSVSPLPVDYSFDDGAASALKPLIPSAFKPITDIWFNRNFAGMPINKESYNKYTPDSQLGRADANKIAVNTSEFLNWLGGGNATTPAGVNAEGRKNILNWLDVSPSTIEHIVTSYASGVGKLINETIVTLTSDKKEVRKIPMINRFYGEVYENDPSKEYYDAKSSIEWINRNIRNSEKLGFKNSLFTEDELGRKEIEYGRYKAELKSTERQINRIKAELEDATFGSDRYNELETEIDRLQRQFLKHYNDDKRD